LAEKVVWADVVVEKSKESFPKMGMDVVGVWRPSAQATDLSAEFSAIKASGAQIIQTTTTGPVRAVLTKQWAETKTPVALTGWNVNAFYPDAWERTKGAVNYEATWATISRVKITDKTIPFWDKFIERFGLESHSATYDSVYVLKDAIERAGTLDPDALVVELEKTDHIGALARQVFTGKETPFPHDITFGPGYATGVGIQWINGKMVTIWPHGRAVLGDKKWVGVRREGTVDYVLPPHVVEYWKKAK
jgi:branched-chain amino acid transport system substrate-binding protein